MEHPLDSGEGMEIGRPIPAEEEERLDAGFEVEPTSRLSCQIKGIEALDGLIVHTPSHQGR